MTKIRVLKSGKRAQSVLEYTMVTVCAVLALLTMTKYFKLSVQGKLRQSADEIGEHYNPRHTEGNHALIVKSKVVVESRTFSEKELTALRGVAHDLNENQAIEDDVYGITINGTILPADTVTTQTRNEEVLQ